MSISKAVITGKVVRDPEKRFTPSNVPVTTFSINVETSKSEGMNLVRVITWKNLADTCAETVKKGHKVIVDGRLQTNSYKDTSGVEKKGLELDAVSVEIISGKPEKPEKPADKSNESYDDIPPPSADDYNISSDELIDEEEIPF
ncbi:MAG: single-stranded DNA-binding protein [Cyanobacteriota bacterium]